MTGASIASNGLCPVWILRLNRRMTRHFPFSPFQLLSRFARVKIPRPSMGAGKTDRLPPERQAVRLRTAPLRGGQTVLAYDPDFV